uniref:BED-type domain-containing protein n=1 Tax=Parascaris univalens TaxID=6257 RepID=A0A915C998_PARUN
MDIHNGHIDEHRSAHMVDEVKSEVCERRIFHSYPAEQHINALRQHPPTNPLMHYSSQRNISSNYHRPNEEHPTNDLHRRTTTSIDNNVSSPYPPQSHANEMILNRKFYSNNSTYSSLSNNILNNRTITTTADTNYTHRMMLDVGSNLLQPTDFITRHDRDSRIFAAYMNDERRQQLSATCNSPLNMRYDLEMSTSGYESTQLAAHSFPRNSNIYPSSRTSDSLFNDTRINYENYAPTRNVENSFVSNPESLNRTIANNSDSSLTPSCEVSRKQNSQLTDTTTIQKNERTLDEDSQIGSVKRNFSADNSTIRSVDSSPNFKGNIQSNPKSPKPSDSIGDDLSKSTDVSSADEQMKATSNEEAPLQPCNASESSDISRESDDVNNENTSVQSESSVSASPNDRRSPQQSSCSATTNETPTSSSTDVVALQTEISSRRLQQSFSPTFLNARYPYPNVSSGEALSNITRPSGSFIRPCVTGSNSTATFLHPNGTVIQTNGTFLPSPRGFCRLNDGLTSQMNDRAIGVNNNTLICSTASNNLAMTINDGSTSGATTRLLTAAEMNAMEVSALNRMMGIVLPKNKGNSNLKREWHNVGWFTSEEEMNAVRKRQKVSKWKSVDQISGLKVFFRCNKWKRTNCNYRMFVMYYAMDRISLNESGEHDHSALYVDGKSRDDDTPPPAAARAVFEATPSSAQQRVLDQLLMNATANASLPTTSSYAIDNVFETGSTSGDGSSQPKSTTPSQNTFDSDENASESAYHLSDGQNIAELLQVAADMDLTFTFNSRRTCEYCFESNAPEMKGRMIVFSDMGGKVAVAERHNGVQRGCEEWRKADWKQFLWAVRGKCMNALKGL